MTPTEFLLARIAEDEADPWRGAEIAGADRVVGPAEHAALRADEDAWEARVSAECEAKRRIVQLHGNDWNPRGKCQACDEVGPCDTLCALALPYAEHPDYDEAWRL